jgi:ubiquinone/menaquinone biosynthesis C-methylase UbiE
MSQKDIFIASEGDGYYQRNRARLASAENTIAADRVLADLAALDVRPLRALEIGCSNEWRLEALRRKYGARCFGVDPSSEAVKEGVAQFPAVHLQVGTADELPFATDAFDLVIFGFCLYLVDRPDLFKTVCEGDRVLQDGGYLVIFDFSPPFPYRNRYKHREGVYSYKMDYSRAFLWNSAYSVLSQSTFTHSGNAGVSDPDERLSVVILQKNLRQAYPDNPFTRAVP